MAFDFPTNPPHGTIVTMPDNSLRVWDGVKWMAAPSYVSRIQVPSSGYLPPAQSDGSPPATAQTGDLYDNGGFVCVTH